MSRCRAPRRRRAPAASWLLSLTLAAGAAGAQTAEPAAPDPCAAAPTFVDTVVNGETRGGTLALILPDGVWLDPAVLRPSEDAYVAGRVTCDGAAFVRLDPRLEVQFDAAELTLDIRPRLELLPGNTIDLGGRAAPATPVSALPLFTLSARSSLSRTPAPAGLPGQTAQLSHSASVRAGVQWGRVQVGAALSEAGAGAAVQWQGEASTTYDVSEQLALGAQVYARRRDGETSLGPQRISGLRVAAGSLRAYRLPEIVIALPLDADVDLRVNTESVPRLRARAGNLVLKNIPVSTSNGTLELIIRDGTGQRTQLVRYTAADVMVSARALAAQGELGVRGQPAGGLVPAATLTAVYGVTDHWSVAGQLNATTTAWSVKASARYADLALNAGLEAEYDSESQAGVALNADATYTRSEWRYGASARVTPLNLSASSLTAQVIWSQPNYSVAVRAQAAPGLGRYGAGLGLTGRVNDQLSAALDGSVLAAGGQLGWKVGLNVTWNPVPKVNVVTTADVQGGADTPARSVLNTQVRYQPAPGHTLVAGGQLGTALIPGAPLERSGRVGYSYDGPARLSASVATSGEWSLSADAGLAWVAGRVYLTPGEPGPGVLVRAGLAGVPLIVNGSRVVTDARGEALVLLGAGSRAASVTPDFDQLPVTVSVREEQRELALAPRGVTVLDWSSNFARFAWVRLLRPDGTPLKYAQLALTGEPTTDDEGWALVPAFSAPLTVQVTGETPDAPPCQAQLVPGTETATCTPASPPAAP